LDKFRELVDIMKTLREPDGCPWDREQTHDSLKPFLIEETYEVLEAIEDGRTELIKEELGDLILQVVFHARIAEEAGEFDIDGVLDAINDKMIRRHPHVFGDEELNTSEEVLVNWEEIKMKEKGSSAERRSILDGVPKQLPGLTRAHRLQERAARVGFDWDRIEDVSAKLDEEVGEFKQTLADGDEARMEDELGDVFFSLVNIARFVGISPEDALRKTISKFIHRFRFVEEESARLGRKLSGMSLEEMDELWERSKVE
jgi:tetrapyrrole methylase family protein/MazG family protein